MKQDKKQTLLNKFLGTFLKTLGVCCGAYLIICVLNAYAPEKTKTSKSTSAQENKSSIEKAKQRITVK